MAFQVRVMRVNEGPHEDSEQLFEAVGMSVDDSENLVVTFPGGSSRFFGSSTWGSATVIRVRAREAEGQAD